MFCFILATTWKLVWCTLWKTICQLCALAAAKKAKSTVGCNKHSITSWSEKVILPLYLVLVQPHLEYCIQFWAPQLKDFKILECVQRRAAELVTSYEEWLRTLNLLNLEKGRLRIDLVALYNFLRWGNWEGAAHRFSLISRARTQGSSSKLCWEGSG